MKFIYKSKGSADDWTEDVIEAPSRKEVLERLDAIYGIRRDEDGKQTNADMIQVELLTDNEG